MNNTQANRKIPEASDEASFFRFGEECGERMHGLSSKEVQKRLLHYGPNILQEKKRISPLKLLAAQFADLMVLILLASTLISIVMGEFSEALAIIIIVVINATMGFVQEFRTEKSMEALRSMAAPTARVVRDGKLCVVPAAEVVPGDCVMFEAGDRVPADGVVTMAVALYSDESMLTGESLPVEKKRSSGMHMGTMVTAGRGSMEVRCTGMDTEMGKIAGMIQEAAQDDTPLKRRLEKLGRLIVAGCLVICAIVTVAGLLKGEPLFQMFLTGVSLAVAAIPEGLPAVVTISLAIGVQKMLRRNALIRRLPAVETLGCASVICSDKTGTLTLNQMTVRSIYCADQWLDEGAAGWGAMGAGAGRGAALELMMRAAVLCNNSLDGGDATETALISGARLWGMDPVKVSQMYRREKEVPFDSDRKCMSTMHCDKKGARYVFTKGAPEVVLSKCSRVYQSSGIMPVTQDMAERILKNNEKMADRALRVIAVAYKEMNNGLRDSSNGELENGLVFLGLIGMMDPPRPEAYEAVLLCKQAGIRPVMITGDHRATAAAVAGELGILSTEQDVVTGDQLERMDDEMLSKCCRKAAVFARVTPRHKLRIVRSLKGQGHIVAMTGDGVNDAPAIKEADIGVAMGQMGTDVTREAAAMVLLDDNFATIVAAVEEGRAIYANIRKFIRYMLSCNIGEVLTMFLGALLGLPLPLVPIQILWVNLVTDGLPAVALALEPSDREVMHNMPRKPDEGVFSDGLGSIIVIRGLIIGMSTLAAFIAAFYLSGNIGMARTAAFLTLCITQLIHVFECKSENHTIFGINLQNNPYLVIAVVISFFMLLSVIYVPFLAGIFGTVVPDIKTWGVVMATSMIGPLLSVFFIPRHKSTNNNN